MALRARLTPPKPEQRDWPWHKVNASSVRASTILSGARRMEAESYLTGGYAIRQAIEKQKTGWQELSDAAGVTQPGRLKGTNVSSGFGVPYFSATQVFDLRPTPRRWLAAEKISNSDELRVENGQILVTRSGSVGRATIAYAAHENALVSDDLLRITPNDPANWGWIYAYLRSSAAQQAMRSMHYGHVIKHLEVGHLTSFPFVTLSDSQRETFTTKVDKILENRNLAWSLQLEAEQHLSTATGVTTKREGHERRYVAVSASRVFSGRRRLEASFYEPRVQEILRAFNNRGLKLEPLSTVTDQVWWMTRFSRSFGDEGMPYRSTDDLFAISPLPGKKIQLGPIDNWTEYTVQRDWILMACSGQTYGLNGSVALASADDEGVFFSHDLIRIKPAIEAIRPGYLYAYLGHPDIGQPLIKRNAYGSSVPHLEPSDIETIPIARLSRELEDAIADSAEKAAHLRSEANAIERSIAEEADQIVRSFADL